MFLACRTSVRVPQLGQCKAPGGGPVPKTKTSTGMKHEIEVCDEHRKDIEEVLEALDSFTGHARRIGPNAPQRRGQVVAAPAPAKSKRGRGNADYDAKAVREWTAADGVEVSERGRISTTVLEQYRAAQDEAQVSGDRRSLDRSHARCSPSTAVEHAEGAACWMALNN